MRTTRGSSRPFCLSGWDTQPPYPGGVGGPGDPPGQTPQLSPRCGPGDPPPEDLQGMLGYHLQGILGYHQDLLKECWDTGLPRDPPGQTPQLSPGIPPPPQGMLGYHPPGPGDTC